MNALADDAAVFLEARNFRNSIDRNLERLLASADDEEKTPDLSTALAEACDLIEELLADYRVGIVRSGMATAKIAKWRKLYSEE